MRVRVGLAFMFGAFILASPALRSVQAASVEITPRADAWVNRAKPDTNYGTFQALRAAAGDNETILRFRTAGWSGLPVASLTLTLGGLSGPAAGLAVDETAKGWKETTVTWRTRPATVSALVAVPTGSGTSVTFDVTDLFPGGVVDRNAVSLRIRNTSSEVVTFGARESATPPRLSLDSSPPAVQPEELQPYADTWADSAHAAKTHGSTKALFSDNQPRQEAFLAFDVSGWKGREYKNMTLVLQQTSSGVTGISVYRASTSWTEAGLTWKNRPTTGGLVAQAGSRAVAGPLTIDVSGTYAAGTVETGKLSLRIVVTGPTAFTFSSRETDNPAVLQITPKSAPPTPTAPPTATPTASPTATPTASPSPSPTASPTASPSPSPTATATATPTLAATPSACPTPEPLFFFDGRGTDHGVGMSQQGARGRAAAGQTYDQILSFYYTGVDFTTIDGTTPIRVLLTDGFTPSATLPARVTAYLGGWQSAAFPGMTFPQGSYVEMWPPSPTASPTPQPTIPATPTPTATLLPMAITGDMLALAVPTASPTATPTSSPTASGCPVSPTPAATSTPSPTPQPTASNTASPSPTPTPVVSPSGEPTPTPPPVWTATVRDSAGNVIATASTNDLVVETLGADGVLEMRFRDDLSKYKLYRGQMRMLVTPTGLEAINILPMESYLRGVVPAEMPATWPREAVKTQAVAARTYAWSRLKGDQRQWDVVPTAANQVYGGYQHEHPNSDAAVLATQNVVLTYKGKVISAVFHACAGGYTENSEYAFVNDKGDPGTVVPYLRGKPDVDANGVPYDINAGTYAWHSGQFTMSQLSKMMSSNSMTDVGTISDITFYRGVSGRVYKVVLTGSKGTKEVSGGKFKNTYNNNRASGSPDMESNLFFLTPAS